MFATRTVELWEKADHVETGGKVLTPGYSLAHASVPCDLQPLRTQEKIMAGLDVTAEIKRAFLPLSVDLSPFMILVDPTERRFYRLEGRGDKWEPFAGDAGHWEALFLEMDKAPSEITGG